LSGYAPLFSSLTTGTLCGKWPDIGLWPIVLSLKDRNGVVDVTPDYLSRVTGLSLEEVVACMARFCEPDPYSRSTAQEGRRLVLLEPERRNWGWRVVNSGLYRERARLQSKDAERTASGADAERKRKERESPGVPRSPPVSPEVPLSEAEAEASKKARTKRASRLPEDFSPDLEEARKSIPDLDAEAEFARFRDYWRAKSGANGTKADWPATWRNWIRNCKDSGRYARRKEAARTNGLPVLNG
jgi:hypothetical protein